MSEQVNTFEAQQQGRPTGPLVQGYEVIIGFETHAQLSTASKIFSRASTAFGAEPNTQACAVDLALPGTLPVMNKGAVERAIKLGLALGSTIAPRSVFARKNYFYPDLPKGYQISQYEQPLATGGHVEIADGASLRRVRLNRIHMEEDAGKLLHEGFPWSDGRSGVDFNRSGVPLIEIVSEPDLRSANEAHEYLTALKAILLYAGVSDGNMEEGSLRCDANVSVRRHGTEAMGTRVEVKNLNSFRNVARAIEHEAGRQAALLESGRAVAQETRLWNADRGETASMRGKEEAHDYRYFPEPDLPPLAVTPEWIEEVRASLPELPAEKRRRFAAEYALPGYDAGVLTTERAVADYFESVARGSGNTKAASNWVMTDVLRKRKDGEEAIAVPAEHLAELIRLIDAGTISGRTAKELFERMWETGEAPGELVSREGLGQVSDEAELRSAIEAVLAGSPEQVATYRKGKTSTLGWFVGQVMRRTGGKANPQLVNELLKRTLEEQ
jgi:aspartyl-tRNA(Asn)/glutamyl-tRNA(Gln) amidotransferase subunit B